MLQYGNIPDTSTLSNKNAGSTEYRLMKMVKSSQAGTCQLSSNREGSTDKKVVSFQDDFWGVDTSSADSISSSPSTLRTCKTEHQPRSSNSVIQRAGGRRSQTQTKVSTKASYHEVRKSSCLIKETDAHLKKYFYFSLPIAIDIPC